MIVLRFGRTGRLARICEVAIQLAFDSADVFSVNRSGEFVNENNIIGKTKYDSLELLLHTYKVKNIVVIDASIDHSSTDNLIIHETFKRNVIAYLNERRLLLKAIGFSSGITLVESNRIRSYEFHMQEYRRQKVEQEVLFSTLACPVFIPNIFTLVGPITYETQSAAWAKILNARIRKSKDIILNEPYIKKAWTSEFKLFSDILSFLIVTDPLSKCGSYSSGNFTLDEIAKGPILNLPELDYNIGNLQGWLDGDYVPIMPTCEKELLINELVRSLCTKLYK